LAVLAATSACDPVGDDARAALGPETPGVRPGPFHRPGQPCLVCHDGAFGDPGAFSVAGTVFATPSSSAGAEQVYISLKDSTDSGYQAGPTNSAGNFYVTPDQWNPVFPLSGISILGFATMQSNVGRDGACASCHFKPAGPDSPGQVCLMLDGGGVPP
jgi:hypothetical protein